MCLHDSCAFLVLMLMVMLVLCFGDDPDEAGRAPGDGGGRGELVVLGLLAWGLTVWWRMRDRCDMDGSLASISSRRVQ